MTAPIIWLDPSAIIADNYNGRDTDDAVGRVNVASIADDMRANGYRVERGLVQVRRDGSQWFAVDGHHRIAAAILAAVDVAAVDVTDEDATARRVDQMRANLSGRRDDDLVVAERLAELVAAGASIDDLRRGTSHTRRWFEDRLALAALPDAVRFLARSHGLRFAQALDHLPPSAAVTAARVLTEHPAWNLPRWIAYVDTYTASWNAEQNAASSMFGGDWSLAEQVWTGSAYVDASDLETIVVDDTAPEPLALADIAALLNVPRSTIYTWQKRGKLPAPDVTLGASGVCLWWRSTIDAWQVAA